VSRSILESAVGFAVLAVAGGFAWYAATISGSAFGSKGYEITARFDRVGGVSVGSDVRLSGVKVGSVAKIVLDPESYFVDLTLSLPNSLKIPSETVVQITSDGLLGGRYVSLLPGNDDRMLKPGERLSRTQAPVDLIDLVSRFAFSSGSSGGASPGSTPDAPK
jgi:phospholipid/cholesterol/gamma-HCH transport system substrate-binding protein